MGRAVFSVGDPAGFRPLEPVIESSAPFISSRWGDYSATVPDPVRLGKFWGIHEYTPGGNSWNTWIARYHAGPCDTMGDENGDCAIDLADMEDFSDCMWGLTLPSLFTCRCFDFDDDTFVSLSDFAEFQLSFTGGAAIPGCDP
jgi:hypothetical protein